MTWGYWINSNYNTIGATLKYNGMVYVDTKEIASVSENYAQNTDMEILKYKEYYLSIGGSN